MKTRKITLLKVHFGQFCHALSLSFKFFRELFSAPLNIKNVLYRQYQHDDVLQKKNCTLTLTFVKPRRNPLYPISPYLTIVTAMMPTTMSLERQRRVRSLTFFFGFSGMVSS